MSTCAHEDTTATGSGHAPSPAAYFNTLSADDFKKECAAILGRISVGSEPSHIPIGRAMFSSVFTRHASVHFSRPRFHPPESLHVDPLLLSIKYLATSITGGFLKETHTAVFVSEFLVKICKTLMNRVYV